MANDDVAGADGGDVDRMLVKDLRKELLKRGLSVSGLKAELRKRLRTHMAQEVKVSVDEHKAGDTKGASMQATTMPPIEPKAGVTEGKEQEDWRIAAEKRRLAALEIRAKKKMMLEAEGEAKKPAVVPRGALVTPSASKKMPFNPYAKKASPAVANPYSSPSKPTPNSNAAAPTLATPKSPANPYAKKAPSPAPKYGPKPVDQLPAVTSAWGDCRLDLWEALCTCGGERKSPDVRMCRCLAALDAGLGCPCNAGVLLIKSGPRGYFWGCSTYKKKGCKETKKFGPPHDAQAARQLAQIKLQSMQKADQEREEWSRIADPYERDWRSVCRCDGAKSLNTFECFMQSEGGCGMMALCPEQCGGQLFLHQSKYGNGRWWGCSNFRNGRCKFRKNYIEHK